MDFDVSREKFDVIIQAGQSNAEGNGIGGDKNRIVLSDKVFWMEKEKIVSIVKSKEFGENLSINYTDSPYLITKAQEYIDVNDRPCDYSVSFSDLYCKKYLEKDRKVLVIRAAVGGSGFRKGQWGVGRLLYEKMLVMIDHALSLNADNRLIALLWHQGEHDAYEKNPPQTFERQLTEMFADLRSRYNDLPIITGDFCRDWADRHSDITMPIRERIKTVTEKFGGIFVSSEGLASNDQMTANSDIIHFSRDAQYELGERYFAAYEKLIKKLK